MKTHPSDYHQYTNIVKKKKQDPKPRNAKEMLASIKTKHATKQATKIDLRGLNNIEKHVIAETKLTYDKLYRK